MNKTIVKPRVAAAVGRKTILCIAATTGADNFQGGEPWSLCILKAANARYFQYATWPVKRGSILYFSNRMTFTQFKPVTGNAPSSGVVAQRYVACAWLVMYASFCAPHKWQANITTDYVVTLVRCRALMEGLVGRWYLVRHARELRLNRASEVHSCYQTRIGNPTPRILCYHFQP